MAENLQTVDELDARVIATLERHREQGSSAAGADFLYPVIIGRGGQARISDSLNGIMGLQPSGNSLGVLHVALHAQRQGLDPEQGVMGALRVHCHAEIAQADGNPVEGEGQRAKGFVELQAVIGGLGLRQRGELVAC